MKTKKIHKKKAKQVKKSTAYVSKYPILQKVLYNTKFTYTIIKSKSNTRQYFIQAAYRCFDRLVCYYIYVDKANNYVSMCNKEIRKLIKDDTLCIHTLKVISYSYKEFKKEYATY